METIHGSLSTRYQQVDGIVNIREPKTRRMAGRAAQQRMLLECFGICQVVNTMKFPIPDSIRQSGNSLLLDILLASSENSAASACHTSVTLKKERSCSIGTPTATTLKRAASSNRALPAPSCLSERCLYHLMMWHKNKDKPDDAHDTSTVPPGWIMSSHADGGRDLEMLRHLRTPAHSRPCPAPSQQARLACLHRVPRLCMCSFSASSLQAPSCERCCFLL